ncbi:MAG TPA: type II secretion system protein [Dehalococcoidales bacterium]
MLYFRKWLCHYQKGFTLIELLIVVALLSVLSGVVIPNANSFMEFSTVNVANAELANVKTALTGYYAEHNAWPTDTNDISTLIAGTLRARYIIDTESGFVVAISDVTWSRVSWSTPSGPPYTQHGEWIRQ